MAVHLPITVEAQKEARELMLSSKNLLKPATGEPITNPTQDIVLGCYFLTSVKDNAKGTGKTFSSKNEAVLAFDFGYVDINALVKVLVKPEDRNSPAESYMETSVGRIIFNWALGERDLKFVNRELNKKDLETLVADIIDQFGVESTVRMLDIMKKLGFEYASKSGISWGMADLSVPAAKAGIIAASEKQVELINEQYQNGLLTDDERYHKVVEIWADAKVSVGKKVPEELVKYGSVYSILRSKARGSEAQLIQMAGMKGPVVNPSGEIIELPIKKSYKEGLGILEYFISTHGARKGTADTALRTASAGYLTRKLVDVAQDVIVKEEDCKDSKGYVMLKSDSKAIGQNFAVPVRKLLKKADDLSKGDLKSRFYSESKDEIGQLAVAFNKIANQLEESNTENENTKKSVGIKVEAETQGFKETIGALEQKVQNRTLELSKINTDLEKFKESSRAREAEAAELKNQMADMKKKLEEHSGKKAKPEKVKKAAVPKTEAKSKDLEKTIGALEEKVKHRAEELEEEKKKEIDKLEEKIQKLKQQSQVPEVPEEK